MQHGSNLLYALLNAYSLAPTLKLIGNGLIMGANELLAETLTLGDKSGIGADTVYGLVKGTSVGDSVEITD